MGSGVNRSKKYYTLWTLPGKLRKNPLKGIDTSKINIESLDIEKIKKEVEEEIADRIKPFDTPFNTGLLNKIVG